jgi:hypothetical protein
MNLPRRWADIEKNEALATIAGSLAAWLAFVLLLCLVSLPGQAGEKRQKVIDFEDEVVEGMSKRPLDSLSQLSEAEKRRRAMHLYRKRAGFRTETSETLRLLRYLP